LHSAAPHTTGHRYVASVHLHRPTARATAPVWPPRTPSDRVDPHPPHTPTGVFESPTGTGKSMSMICSSLAWLRANESRELLMPVVTVPPPTPPLSADSTGAHVGKGKKADDVEPAWVRTHAAHAAVEAAQRAKKEREEQREEIARKREEARKRVQLHQAKRQRRTAPEGRQADKGRTSLIASVDDSATLLVACWRIQSFIHHG
jgi:hypothetical protein